MDRTLGENFGGVVGKLWTGAELVRDPGGSQGLEIHGRLFGWVLRADKDGGFAELIGKRHKMQGCILIESTSRGGA